MRQFGAICLLAGAGCAIGFPVQRHKVVEVEVAGADNVDEDDISEGLANRPPVGIVFREYAPYDRLALEIDKRRIRSFYERQGYFSAKVTSADVQFDDPNDPESDATVRFEVEEGTVSRVRSVRIVSSSTVVKDKELLSLADFEVGEPFRHEQYLDAKTRYANVFATRGHPRAKIDGRIAVDRDQHAVDIEITVEPGPLVHFDQTTITSPDVPESAIRYRTAWATGDVYDPMLLKITEGRLYTLGLVGSVRFIPKYHSNDAKLDVGIEISETSKNELRLGGGIERSNTALTASLRGTYVRRDFFHPLMSLRLDLRPQLTLDTGPFGPSIESAAEIERDDFLYPRLQLRTGFTYRLIRYEAFRTEGPSARIVVGRPFKDDRLKLTASLQFAYYRVASDVIPTDQKDIFGIKDGFFVLFSVLSVVYDGRDNPINPTSGFQVGMPVEIGRGFGFSGGPYVKLTPEVQAYLSLGTPRLVLAARVRVGANVANKPLPITQRYFSGGSDSQRGFGRRRLSPGFVGQPLDDKGAPNGDPRYYPLGGEANFLGNLELRLQLFRVWGEWFGVVGFVDAGDAKNELTDLEFLNPHVAAGGGLRYQTPVGPIRLDVGFRLNRFGPGDIDPASNAFDRLAIHISIGEAF